MKTNARYFFDFEKVDSLLESFNKTTGFVTAILDLEGNVLSKSGWRQICTEFHRIHPETSKKCAISDTVLANKMAEGENYHFYQCLNGLVDVAVPIVIKGEHIANLFSGQFFFEEPDEAFFKKQAAKYGFNQEKYLQALRNVPVVSKEKVTVAMDFLLNMTQMISEMSYQKLEQMELNEAILKSENILQLFVEHSPASIAMFDKNMHYLVASRRFLSDYNLGNIDIIGKSHYEIFPEISGQWKEFHQRGMAGETLKESNDPFPRADGSIDWVRWEIRPWYESENQIGGIILFSEVITQQVEAELELAESEKYNRMLFEQSAIGLALTSFDGKLVDINTTFSNIIGRTVEEAKALTYWDITPEKYKELEQQQLDTLAQTGRYGPYEKEYIHKDGHLVPVRLQGLVIERNNEKFIWSSVEDITERKEFEDALRESEGKFRKIYEEGPFGMAMVNESFKFIMANRKFCELTGYTESELCEFTFRDITYVDDRDISVESIRKLINGEIPVYRAEKRYVRKDGGIFWGAITVTANFDKDGKFLYNVSVVEDITRRKQAEQLLKSSEENYRTIFEFSPIAAAFWDKEAKIIFWNKAAENVFGWTKDEVIGRKFTQFFIPESSRAYVEENIDQLINSIPRETTINENLRKDGTAILCEWTNTIIHDKDGNPATIISLAKDVTEQKRIEDKLRQSEQKFNKAFHNSPDAITLTRVSDGKMIEINDQLVKISGYTREEIIGNTSIGLSLWVNPDDRDRYVSTLKAEGRIIDFETDFRLKSGEIRNFSLSGEIFKINDENFILGIIRDITDRKLAELEILKLNQSLENKVVERTAQLTNANRELETFTYSVSHDLKAPLRGIDGYSKLLSDLYAKDLNDEAKHFISVIRNSTLQMGQLIEDLLQYSRLERSQRRTELVNIRQVADSILKINQDELLAHNFRFENNLPDVSIFADSGGIQIALRNLIGNAIKFSGSVARPALSLSMDETPNSWVIAVRDNGVGFDMKYHQRIFEIFQRLHRAEEYPGTGIGLAMVSKAMQRMNGRVWAESEPGKGATFYLEVSKPN